MELEKLCRQKSISSDGGKSSDSVITHTHDHQQTDHPSSNSNTVVLALCVPTPITKNQTPTPTGHNSGLRRPKKERRWPPSAPAVCVFKFLDLSWCCDCGLADKLRRLNLSGCAVVSKGVLVVEGKIGSIRGLSKFLRLSDCRARVVCVGKISRPNFATCNIRRQKRGKCGPLLLIKFQLCSALLCFSTTTRGFDVLVKGG
ncbi:disease resistance protein [Striga asiatica]|uniref:Disease resistance protein n=1 Tax=Striga asiatica TaxID=4170 RepID=A0A5A7PMH6_STRAF|nr:disease resistance protein [Striga asiatica]